MNSFWDTATADGVTLDEALRLISADPDDLTPEEHTNLADIRGRAIDHVLTLCENGDPRYKPEQELRIIADSCYETLWEDDDLVGSAFDAAVGAGGDWERHSPSPENDPWSTAMANIERLLFGCGLHADRAVRALRDAETTVTGDKTWDFFQEGLEEMYDAPYDPLRNGCMLPACNICGDGAVQCLPPSKRV